MGVKKCRANISGWLHLLWQATRIRSLCNSSENKLGLTDLRIFVIWREPTIAPVGEKASSI